MKERIIKQFLVIEEEGSHLNAERLQGMIIAIVFFCVLLVPLCTIDWRGGELSVAENRYLAEFPQIFDSEGRVSETLGQELLDWFQDNLGFREDFIDLCNQINSEILGKPISKKVELGIDGWLYYTLEDNMNIVKNTYPNFDESVLEKICQQQIKIKDKLAEQGIEYVLALSPSKVSIYPEYIASGEYEIQSTPVDILADYLEAHSDLKVIRLKDALLKEKALSDELLYFKTDTHWNWKGCYIAYEDIVEHLNKWGIMKKEPVEVSYDIGERTGDLSVMLGKKDEDAIEKSPIWVINDQRAKLIKNGERYKMLSEYLLEEDIPQGFYYENASDIDGISMVFFADSMFGSFMLPLLAESCSDMTFVWNYKIDSGLIKKLQPDVVMFSMGERYLNRMLLIQHEIIKER